jgi:hypothetical protein
MNLNIQPDLDLQAKDRVPNEPVPLRSLKSSSSLPVIQPCSGSAHHKGFLSSRYFRDQRIDQMKFRCAHLATVATIVMFNGAAGEDGSKKPAPAIVQEFTGEIMDSICAGYKGHSYMMQQLKSMGTDKESCIKSCINATGSEVRAF